VRPEEPAAPRPRWGLHLALFLLTLVTSTLAGGLDHALAWAVYRIAPALHVAPEAVRLRDVWLALTGGWLAWSDVAGELLMMGGMFSSSLLTILLAHELGHYVAARLHRAEVSPPYFIPGPPLAPLPGTFGAFIRLRRPVMSSGALLDVGAAGPLAGIVVAVPVLLLGLSLSEVGPIRDGGLYEGNSLLYLGAKWLVHGPIPAGHDVFLHPVALAGWWGILVTALNLFPVGQLDGGHVAYALFGERAVNVNRAVFGGLLGLAVGLFLHNGMDGPALMEKGAGAWIPWIVLMLVIGLEHPPMGDPSERLGPGRRVAGWACLLVFLLTFTPVPMSTEPPEAVLPGAAAVAEEAPAEPEEEP